MREFGAGRRGTDGEVARCPRSAGIPAPRRMRMIDERIGMFAATRVRPDRVRGWLNSIASRPDGSPRRPAPPLVETRRPALRLLWYGMFDACALLTPIREQLPEPQARATVVAP